jgi:DNA-binding response OmpR family regulator
VDVPFVRWPEDHEKLEQLRQEGTPRLLLVDADAPSPVVADCLEDWVRLPAADADVRARADALRLRAARHGAPEAEVDPQGVVRVGDRSVVLPPVEAALAVVLAERMGAVVGRGALLRAAWPDGEPDRNLLDVRILRLRRRLAPLGLVIRTVRARGYLMELETASVQEPVRGA